MILITTPVRALTEITDARDITSVHTNGGKCS
jgi:hypothetical protein